MIVIVVRMPLMPCVLKAGHFYMVLLPVGIALFELIYRRYKSEFLRTKASTLDVNLVFLLDQGIQFRL